MGKMMWELEDYGIGPDKWVRCWAHIINLLVTTLFAYFDNTSKPKPTDLREPSEEDEPSFRERQLALDHEADGDDDGDGEHDAMRAHKMDEDKLEGVYADVRGRSDAGARQAHEEETDEDEIERFEPRRESLTDRYTRSSTKFTIMKAQQLAERFRYNSACRKALVNLSLAAVPVPCGPHSIYPAVKTRWNSQCRQFRQIVNHRTQIEKIQTDARFKFKKENKLTVADFELLEDLLKVLEPFEGMTQKFSTLGGGQVEDVIPVIDELVRHIESYLSEPLTVPALHNALILVLNKLFFYYGKTGDCPYYAAAILLHPGLGIRYLRAQRWPQSWIDEAVDATQELYNTRHKRMAKMKREWARNKRVSLSNTPKMTRELMSEVDDDQMDLDKIIYNFASGRHPDTDSEGKEIVALQYWKQLYTIGEHKEGLTELALDVFGCPASSVDVERAFSFGGFTVSKRRHNLSSGTVTAAMFVAACNKHDLITPGMLREGREKRAAKKRTAESVLELSPSDSDSE
ncbi:hypothetical protein JCM1841_002525 [Sporobolomyces salmonicolor]